MMMFVNGYGVLMFGDKEQVRPVLSEVECDILFLAWLKAGLKAQASMALVPSPFTLDYCSDLMW